MTHIPHPMDLAVRPTLSALREAARAWSDTGTTVTQEERTWATVCVSASVCGRGQYRHVQLPESVVRVVTTLARSSGEEGWLTVLHEGRDLFVLSRVDPRVRALATVGRRSAVGIRRALKKCAADPEALAVCVTRMGGWCEVPRTLVDDGGPEGALYDVNIRGMETIRLLFVKCPSTGREHILTVPATCDTAASARRWTLGLNPDSNLEVET